MNAAVAYLESEEYAESGWTRGLPYPLLSLDDPFDCAFDGGNERLRTMYCDSEVALCTGDGFRWTPGVPELRFT